MSQFFQSWSRGRCWADNQLSCHLKPSGHAFHGEVNGLDSVEQHRQWSVLLCHTHEPLRGYIPFVKAGTETSNTGAEAVKPHPSCSWQGHSRRVGANVGNEGIEFCSVLQQLRIPSVIYPENLLLSSGELISCCAAGTNGCLDLRCRASPLGGQVSTEWRWIGILSAAVGRRHPVTVCMTSLMILSMMGMWLFGLTISVLVVPVLRYFSQAMKSCRNLACSLFNANVLKSTKGFILKKSINIIQDPTVDQHEHMIFVIISKQIKSL